MIGELAEWVKAGVLKMSECNKLQGFESSTLRQIDWVTCHLGY